MKLIDADALMEAINTWPKFGVDERGRIVPWNERYEPYIHLRDAVIAITGMPTIEPQRKTGKWIEQDDGWDGVYYECSCCKEAFTLIDGTPSDNLYNFCPNCGSDMRTG